jgi:hypothetical protein
MIPHVLDPLFPNTQNHDSLFSDLDELPTPVEDPLPEISPQDQLRIDTLIGEVAPVQDVQDLPPIVRRSLPPAICVRIAIQPLDQRKKLQSFIGDQNDRTNLMAWVRALPAVYTANFAPSKKRITLYAAEIAKLINDHVPRDRAYTPQEIKALIKPYLPRFPHSMTISGPVQRVYRANLPALFQVYFLPDLSRFEIYYCGPGDLRLLDCPQFELQILRPDGPGYVGVVGFPFARALSEAEMVKKQSASHPFRRFRARLKAALKSASRSDTQGELSLGILLSPDAMITRAVKQRNEQARHNLGKFLSDFSKGSVRILWSEVTGTPMFELGNGQYLFGFTLVFPWTLAILALIPNCLETDTSCYCIRPYTMAWLLAIFANTSVPIAVGISPSETSESYIRIYDHIHELMKIHQPWMLNGPTRDVDELERADATRLQEGFFPENLTAPNGGNAPPPAKTLLRVPS